VGVLPKWSSSTEHWYIASLVSFPSCLQTLKCGGSCSVLGSVIRSQSSKFQLGKHGPISRDKSWRSPWGHQASPPPPSVFSFPQVWSFQSHQYKWYVWMLVCYQESPLPPSLRFIWSSFASVCGSAPDLPSGHHSNPHFLCNAEECTPPLGKCLPDYNHPVSVAEEIRQLSDSEKEKHHQVTRTWLTCLAEGTGLLTTGCSSCIMKAKDHQRVWGGGMQLSHSDPHVLFLSNYLLTPPTPLKVTFNIIELAYGHNHTLSPLVCLPFFPVKGNRLESGSVGKNTDCSSEGPEFKSQQPHGGSQPSVTRSDSLFWSVWRQLQCTYI
jgi:hypothetical protein